MRSRPQSSSLRRPLHRLRQSVAAAQSRMRLAYGFAAALIIAALFALGRTQYAIGLVPNPWDKLLHMIVFAVLTVLLYCASDARAARLAVLVALALAVADEGHQLFLPGRSSDVTDIVADTFGIALAAIVIRQKQKE